MPDSPRPARMWSYRLSLAVAMPALVGLTGGVLIYLHYRFVHKAIDDASTQLFTEISRWAVESTSGQLRQAIPAVESANAILGERARHEDPKLADDLLAIAHANPGFTWVSYADASGAFTGIFHGSHDEWRLNSSRIKDGKTALDEYDLDAAGHRTLRRHEDDTGYDPRKRPFYKLVEEQGRRMWTQPYIFYEEGVPGITCATPHFDASGTLTGVFTVDLDLNRLSKMAQSLNPSPNGLVFLYTPDGTVLAYPGVSRTEKSGQRGQGELLRTDKVPDPIFQDYLAATAGDPALAAAAQGEGVATFSFAHAGERYVASYDLVDVDKSIQWVVGVYAPESDYLSDMQKKTFFTVGISAFLVILALFFSVLGANWMLRPLGQVVSEMERVGEFRLETAPQAKTWFKEIAVLNRTLEAMKGSLRSFSSYVPRKLVRLLLSTGGEAVLGGKLKELTIFFSDIANFTSYAETLKPDELVLKLGAYFEQMAHTIEECGGTVDKFLGDGIMAFWGAPEEMADHAEKACMAALSCQKRLTELRKSGGVEPLATRIGLCSGEVLVGNIGTADRMNYTVMGDTANLASRLEGLNKLYGTFILAGESTIRAAGPKIISRAVDVVAVKGKARGVKVYELLALADDGDTQAMELSNRAEAALNAYLKRDFAKAAEEYRAILSRKPGDKAAQVLLARCEDLVRAPPAPDWSGVHQLHEK